MKPPVSYRTVQVDGLSIFYREAGPQDAPTLLLLHGLPSSSRMYEPLLTRLSDRYHLIAPDYPGFGHSDWPEREQFAYTFDNIASVMEHFTEALGLGKYTLYMQDYGGHFALDTAANEIAQLVDGFLVGSIHSTSRNAPGGRRYRAFRVSWA